jgi:hypothetical protein
LPISDIEWLLICVREKSIGGKQEVEYVCNEKFEDKPCGSTFKETIDFTKLEIIRGDDKIKDKMELSPGMGIKLKPPSFNTLYLEEKTDDIIDYSRLADIVEYVYDKDQVYKFSEATKDEIKEFFDSFGKEQIDQLYQYISSMPRYEINIQHKCKKCGFEHKIKVDDLSNLFQ